MSDQSHHWSQAAVNYESDFVDPYRADVHNPVIESLKKLRLTKRQTVADLGCGIGPLLPFLAEHFGTIHAVDFAEGMLKRAKERCRDHPQVQFLEARLTDLKPLHGQLDVAVAVNSLVLPDVRDLDKVLREIRTRLKPKGRFVAILPAMDSVHYYTMLLLDRALASGKPLDAARKNAEQFSEHQYYDFAFGQFNYKGLEQHFWQPFEIRYRLQRAGFFEIRLKKVRLAWDQFLFSKELRKYPAPWDWFVEARAKKVKTIVQRG